MVRNYRLFNGKKFRYYSTYNTYTKANQQKYVMKDYIGVYVRIIKSKTGYEIWIHTK
jgi:hypothetical protein